MKIAYHCLGDDHERNLPSSSSSHNDQVWKEIWRAKIPNRVKNFLWRLTRSIPPTRANLSKKGIQLDQTCPLCNNAIETSDHLFTECSISKLTLFASTLGGHSPHQADIIGWLLKWLTCKDVENSQLFCTLLWMLWKARNEAVFKNTRPDPIKIVQTATEFVSEFKQGKLSSN